MAKLPKFLCIGAQRSGSTWLYQNLSSHPDIWFPPIKELHFFDQTKIEPFFCKRYKGHLRGQIRANLASINNRNWSYSRFLWDIKYFTMPRSDRWYCSLFSQGKNKMAGEVTPAYSILTNEVIAQIRNINPDIKIIFLMRDPIDRSWSQARKDLPRVYKKPICEIHEEEVINWFHSHWCDLRSDYLRTLDNWLANFSRDQFFFGFFD